MIFLGIDPGTAVTGYGLIKKKNKDIVLLDYGVIRTDPVFSSPERLKQLYNQLSKIVKKYQPDIAAVEKIYFFKNFKTAIPVAQAKGVILLALVKKGIPISEFTPLQVKMNITGYGRATKTQMQKMVQTILSLEEIPKPDDAADALGVAISCARLF